jgi:hypothetical protein
LCGLIGGLFCTKKIRRRIRTGADDYTHKPDNQAEEDEDKKNEDELRNSRIPRGKAALGWMPDKQ